MNTARLVLRVSVWVSLALGCAGSLSAQAPQRPVASVNQQPRVDVA
jgi:hypothetical protein